MDRHAYIVPWVICHYINLRYLSWKLKVKLLKNSISFTAFMVSDLFWWLRVSSCELNEWMNERSSYIVVLDFFPFINVMSLHNSNAYLMAVLMAMVTEVPRYWIKSVMSNGTQGFPAKFPPLFTCSNQTILQTLWLCVMQLQGSYPNNYISRVCNFNWPTLS